MELNATVQRNRFIMCPFSFLKPKDGYTLSSSERVLSAWFYSFNAAGKTCKAGRTYMSKELGYSRSTLSRKVKSLAEKGAVSVERNGQGCSEYTYQGEIRKGAPHIRMEYVFFTDEFMIVEKVNGKRVKHQRRLKASERDVLALIYSVTWDRKRPFVGSHKDIGVLLGLTEETVCRAVTVLTASHLIEHKIERYNKRELQEHHFYVLMRTLRKHGITRRDLRAERKAAQAEREREQRLPDHIIKANAASARARFYDLRRERAERKAENALERAKKDVRFAEIHADLGRMKIALAKAELRDPAKLPALKAEKAMLDEEYKATLLRLGIDKAAFDKETYRCCRKCSDTGHLPDGTGCDCYTPGAEP